MFAHLLVSTNLHILKVSSNLYFTVPQRSSAGHAVFDLLFTVVELAGYILNSHFNVISIGEILKHDVLFRTGQGTL